MKLNAAQVLFYLAQVLAGEELPEGKYTVAQIMSGIYEILSGGEEPLPEDEKLNAAALLAYIGEAVEQGGGGGGGATQVIEIANDNSFDNEGVCEVNITYYGDDLDWSQISKDDILLTIYGVSKSDVTCTSLTYADNIATATFTYTGADTFTEPGTIEIDGEGLFAGGIFENEGGSLGD